MSSTDVPECSTEGGNTRTPSAPKPAKKPIVNPAIHWVFTLNNWTEEERCSICSIIEATCRYAIVGKEIAPTTGTPHLQGYIEFKSKKRPIGVFKNKRIRWKKAKGKRIHNDIYISKEDENPYVFPSKYYVKIDQFYPWQDKIRSILSTEPDDRSIYWFYEDTGCAGKTTFAKYIYLNYKDVVVLSGKGSDMKNGIIQYQTTNGRLPKIVIINIPRSNSSFVSYTGLEEIKDMFFFSGKYEGGMVCGPNPHLICFANSPPEYEKMSDDRWKVFDIKDFN